MKVKQFHGAGDPCHIVVRGHVFSGEGDIGFSLPNDFTRTADFAILFSQPLLISIRRWSTINVFRSLLKDALCLVNAYSLCKIRVETWSRRADLNR